MINDVHIDPLSTVPTELLFLSNAKDWTHGFHMLGRILWQICISSGSLLDRSTLWELYWKRLSHSQSWPTLKDLPDCGSVFIQCCIRFFSNFMLLGSLPKNYYGTYKVKRKTLPSQKFWLPHVDCDIGALPHTSCTCACLWLIKLSNRNGTSLHF